jgi:CubicO group peptidase (beta-lactamase class C family)
MAIRSPIFTAILVALALGFWPHTSTAQQSESGLSTSIDEFMHNRMHDLRIPGAAVAVVRDGRVEHLRGYGRADDTNRPMTPQTPVHIASLSKAFTAAAIMQLVDSGQLELDAPVQRYLPWFRVADIQASSTMTLRHLLYHTSGLAELEGYERNLDASQSQEALEASIRALAFSNLNHPPGVRYEYSNTNYDILGLIIQTVTGQSYEQYVERALFAPLDMQRSYTSITEARNHGLSSGYYLAMGMPVAFDAFIPVSRATAPSAGLVSTAEDLSHWLLLHLNNGEYRGQQIISPVLTALLHAAGAPIEGQVSYGMGWVTYPLSDADLFTGTAQPAPMGVSHGGVWTGATALITFVPERRVGVVMLLNASNPTVESEWFGLGFDLQLIALGLPPRKAAGQEDFLARNQQWLLLLAVISFAVINVMLTRRRAGARAWLLIFIGQLAVTVYVFLWLLPQSNNTLGLMLRFTPDSGIMLVLMQVLLAWSAIGLLTSARTHKLSTAH